ncbi:thiol peroxidase [Candidatus Latescibacterota bacterium]
MAERTNLITFIGDPLTLVGNEVKVGDKAPDFTAMAIDMTEVKLSSYRGKTVILSAVPSLDTPVCDKETLRFNEEAGKLGDDVAMLTISVDLPFAQGRWCTDNEVKNVVTISDYLNHAFGEAYGILIKELKLLARCIFIIDGEGVIRYIQLVREVASEPDYDDVLSALKNIR